MLSHEHISLYLKICIKLQSRPQQLKHITNSLKSS